MAVGIVLSGTSKEEFIILSSIDVPIGHYVEIADNNGKRWIGIIENKLIKNGVLEKAILDKKITENTITEYSQFIDSNVIFEITPIGMYFNGEIEDVVDIPNGIINIRPLSMEELSKIFPRGEIIIGTIPGSKERISLSLSTIFSPHLGVFGQTGSGKSNFVKLILRQIYKEDPNATIIVLDRHGEYATNEFYAPLRDKTFIFTPKIDITKLDTTSYATFFEMLFKVYSNQTNLNAMLFASLDALQDAAERHKWIFERYTILDFLELLWRRLAGLNVSALTQRNEELDEGERKFREELRKVLAEYEKYIRTIGIEDVQLTAKRLLRRLFSLKRMKLDILEPRPTETTSYLIGKIVPGKMNILRLGNVRSEIYSAVLSILLYETLLLKEGLLDKSKLGQASELAEEGRNIYIVMEESHSYLNKNFEDMLDTTQALVREGRKFGIHLLIVAQNPSSIDTEILSQLTSVVTFRLGSQRDIRVISENYGLPKVLLENLPRYYAVIYSVHFKAPLKVKTFNFKEVSVDYKENEELASELFE